MPLFQVAFSTQTVQSGPIETGFSMTFFFGISAQHVLKRTLVMNPLSRFAAPGSCRAPRFSQLCCSEAGSNLQVCTTCQALTMSVYSQAK